MWDSSYSCFLPSPIPFRPVLWSEGSPCLLLLLSLILHRQYPLETSATSNPISGSVSRTGAKSLRSVVLNILFKCSISLLMFFFFFLPFVLPVTDLLLLTIVNFCLIYLGSYWVHKFNINIFSCSTELLNISKWPSLSLELLFALSLFCLIWR